MIILFSARFIETSTISAFTRRVNITARVCVFTLPMRDPNGGNPRRGVQDKQNRERSTVPITLSSKDSTMNRQTVYRESIDSGEQMRSGHVTFE